jgi:hypothetical protein
MGSGFNMNEHVKRRLIDGTYYICTDIGCPDWQRAEDNRYMVKHRLKITGYLKIEEAVVHTPLSQPLPSWIPLGELPLASNGERHDYGGGYDQGEEYLGIDTG